MDRSSPQKDFPGKPHVAPEKIASDERSVAIDINLLICYMSSNPSTLGARDWGLGTREERESTPSTESRLFSLPGLGARD
jgi:hypothetical protein